MFCGLCGLCHSLKPFLPARLRTGRTPTGPELRVGPQAAALRGWDPGTGGRELGALQRAAVQNRGNAESPAAIRAP